MLQAFHGVSPLPNTSLMLVAPDVGAVSRIFDTWMARHRPDELFDNSRMRAIGANELALQPQLADNVDRGVEGVGYWCGHRLGFYVAAPGEVQLGALGPAATLVKCFEVDDEAEVIVVFAHTVEHARELFREWNLLAYGDDGDSATAQQMSSWLLRWLQVTLGEDMDAGLTGVGSVCEGGFWRIFPQDYEPTYVE